MPAALRCAIVRAGGGLVPVDRRFETLELERTGPVLGVGRSSFT